MNVSLTAVLLVVGVALAFSGLDVTRKMLGARMGPLPLLVMLTAGSLPLFVLWASLEGQWEVTSGYFAPGLASTLINVAANLAFLQAVRISPLSVTIPYLSLTPVFTTLLAIPILGEHPSLLQGVGILVVVLGAFWLNVPSDGSASWQTIWMAPARERGSLLMILCALCWSLAAPLDKLAIKAATPAFHALVMMAGITLCGVLVLAFRRGLEELRVERSSLKLIGASVVLTAVGAGLNFIALQFVWVGFVETLKRALGSTLALVWGRLLFSESLTANKVIAVFLMASGVALILW